MSQVVWLAFCVLVNGEEGQLLALCVLPPWGSTPYILPAFFFLTNSHFLPTQLLLFFLFALLPREALGSWGQKECKPDAS